MQAGCDGEHAASVHRLLGEDSAGVNLVAEGEGGRGVVSRYGQGRGRGGGRGGGGRGPGGDRRVRARK
jgi:hypothetical protein